MPFARIQHRRGTAAQWATENPVLADGELGLEKDTGVVKIGDGVTAWDALPATIASADQISALDARLDALEVSPVVVSANAPTDTSAVWVVLPS